MARYKFGGNTVILSDLTGLPLVGQPGTHYLLEDSTIPLSDLLDINSNTLVGGTVYTVAKGKVPVYIGPDGVTQMWADFGAGRFLTEATDYDESLGTRLSLAELSVTTMSARITTAEASVATAVADAAAASYDPAHYLMSGNLPGVVLLGDVINGGVTVDFDTTPSTVILRLDQQAEGADLLVNFVTDSRSTGVRTVRGMMTFTAGTSRRATLVLSPTFLLPPGDRYNLSVTQLGSTQVGSDLSYSVRGSAATTPAALAVPAPATGLTAVVAGANVAVAWTASATGVRSGYDLYIDGVLADDGRLVRTAVSYVHVGGASAVHTYVLRAWNLDAVSAAVTVTFTPASTVSDNGSWGTAHADATGTALTVPVLVAVPAGQRAFLHVVASGPSTGSVASTWTATDTAGNTWTLVPGAQHYIAAGTTQAALLTTANTAGLAVGQGATLSSGATSVLRMAAIGSSVTGTIGTLDQVLVAGSVTAGRNFATAASATLAQPVEYVVAVFATLVEATMTLGSPLAARGTVQSSAGTNDKQATAGWTVTATTAPITVAATGASSSAWSAVAAVYRAGA